MTPTSSIFSNDTKYTSLLLFGPPGSGKGTMGKFLAGTGNHYHLSSGDIYRGITPESPAGKIINKYIPNGLLLPNDVAIEIWKYYVDALVATNCYFPQKQYLLLDGMPRTLEQARSLDQYVEVKKIIALEASDETLLFERLRGRAKKEGRADDMSDTILKKRMQIYKEETEEMLTHYPKDNIQRINAQQGLFEVLRDILNAVGPLLSFPPKL
jgi:adenylate kinase